MKPTITAIIITKNEENMISECINTLLWCDEILVIDDNSTDKTSQKAEALGAKIISFSNPSFARKRQEAIKRSKSEWLLYIDADERVTPQLAKEIQVNIETKTASVFSLCRDNMFYGKTLTFGGWDNDTVERLFYKDALESWYGDIHESPKYSGTKKILHAPLIHMSHRSTIDGLLKTAAWTPIEAKALFDSNKLEVTPLTIFRKGCMEFIRRAILKKGYKDGQTGIIEAIIQGINRALVYIQVWELQQNPPIANQYIKKEKEIQELWKQNQD